MYKGAKGGRASGKSHFFAELLVDKIVADPDIQAVCVREIQKSLKFSAKKLIEDKIYKFKLGHLFEITQTEIKRKNGRGIIIFQGLQDHTADSIKSLEGFDICWTEEAQSISKRSMELLIPTIRKDTAELWFSWNPRYENDPVEELFRTDDPDFICVHVNYTDNPFCPEKSKKDAARAKSRNIEDYSHIWLGNYENNSEARVFKNWTIEEFEAPKGVHLRFGADWGFSVDPTVLVRCYLVGRTLYVDHEAHMVGCEIVNTPDLFMTIPESEKWPIVADCARPETISHMRNNGFPKIMGAAKGPKSLEDGIEWLKSMDIIVHPRCKHTIDELSLYKYKTDENDKVLPILEDKHNHVIDALRYALEGARRAEKNNKPTTSARIKPRKSVWR